MFEKCIRYAGFLILVALQGFAGQPINAEQIVYVNNTQVNMRSSPTTAEKNIVATVLKDTPVVVLRKQGAWYNVRLPDGREGWISRWVLTSPETVPDMQGRELPQETGEVLPSSPDLTEEMIYISGGDAIIGSDENELQQVIREWTVQRDALTDELPKQSISIPGFFIDQYEVTNAQYKQFVDATRYPPPLNWQDGMYPAGTGNHPVTFVSWDDAHAYAQWAGKRLPTAEEWEFAARGLNGQIFPWGNTYDRQQVNINNSQRGAAPVGSFPNDISGFKVYDMGGNVMEWTMTQYEGSKDFFILKGSSWATAPFEARGANQTPGHAEYRLGHIGFRCVKSGSR
jgi:formylglycine-generating enzyme required for sulfatase activity